MTVTTTGRSMPKVEALIPVQQLDTEIHRLRLQAESKPRELAAAKEKVARAQAVLEEMRAEIKALRLEAAKRETSVKELDDKVNKLLIQMNMAKKNTEYQAFQKEISGHKADKQRVEEGQLDFMYQIEEKSKLEKVRDGEVKAAEAELAVATKKLEGEISVLRAQLGELEAKRAAAVVGIDKELLTLYERILKAKEDGIALAPISRYSAIEEKGMVQYWGCGGCHMGVTSQDASDIKRGKDVVKCRGCSRLVYWTEEPKK